MIPIIKKLPGSYAEAKRAGFNARHDFLTIRIHWDLPYAPAVMGQEVFEFWYKKRWGAKLALPVVAASLALSWLYGPMNLTLLFVAFAVFVHGPSYGPIARKMELIGKNIEVIIAVQFMGSDLATHRASEIKSLLSYPQFKGWPVEAIGPAFDDQRLTALKWVRSNRNTIDRWLLEHDR